MTTIPIGSFLAGDQISLLPPTMEHIDLYWKWSNDYRIRKYFGTSIPKSKSSIQKLIDTPGTSRIWFEIWHNQDEKVIGLYKISSIHWIRRKCSIGALIGDVSYWNHGLTTAATKIIIDYIFGELNLHKINTMVYESNTGSRKVLEKCGFTHEATISDAGYFDGRYCADILYSMTRDAWIGLREPK